jgi:hypothetical protein
MSTDPRNADSNATPVLVEDLFLTDAFLIKGRMAQKYHRLTKMLEDVERSFVTIHDAVMISLRSEDVIRAPSVQVNTREIILAHELVEIAGDQSWRHLAQDRKTVRIRAFYSGGVQIELSGKVEPGAYEPSRGPSRKYFIMQEPTIRGLNLEARPDLRLLKGLSYAIVQKNRLAYIYDFG